MLDVSQAQINSAGIPIIYVFPTEKSISFYETCNFKKINKRQKDVYDNGGFFSKNKGKVYAR